MSTHMNSITGELSFESRDDIPQALDKAPDRLLNAKFVLPQEVDFHFILSPHATDKDFDVVIPTLRTCDMYLAEFAEPDIDAMQFTQELSNGNKTVYSRYKRLINKSDPIEVNSWCDAMFDNIYRYRPKAALFDPPKGHKSYEESYSKKFAELGDDEPIENLTIPSYNELLNRDKWCLKNMKSIVDYLLPYKNGVRRQVLISRGTYHVGLANTIEKVCEVDDARSRGSAVVASTIVLQSNGENTLNQIYIDRIANN